MIVINRNDTPPDVVISYVKMVYNICLLVLMISIVFFIISCVTKDLNVYLEIQKDNNVRLISSCIHDYQKIGCYDDNSKSQITNRICNDLKNCIDKSANINNSKEVLSAIADILNGFFLHLETKSIICIGTLVIILKRW